MTRIGTGLSAKVRTYGVNTTSTVFRLLESAVPQGSQIVNDVSGVPIGTRVDLDSGPVRTLDSAYVQGVTIYNESTVAGEFIYVAGAEYAGVADRKSIRLNSSHIPLFRMPSSA